MELSGHSHLAKHDSYFFSDPKLILDAEDSDPRLRDYKTYMECLKTAYTNDRLNNQESRITADEQSILLTLAKMLELSHEEVKLINYLIVPLSHLEIDEIIKYLTSIGVVFYSKKNYQVYVADEIIGILRQIRGKEIPDKIFRRVLRQLKDAQINQLSRKHNIDRKLSKEEKINKIIDEGISFSNALISGIFKDDVTKNERKLMLNELIEKNLKIDERIKGSTLEEKVKNLVAYFDAKERDGIISISISGFDKLLKDLVKQISGLNKIVKEAFELQEGETLNAKFLLMYNIKPFDLLYLLEDNIIREFCVNHGISTRGNEFQNILDAYKDVEDLFIEHYVNIAKRDYNTLVENGLDIKEAELGLKFEEVTKMIFTRLGFKVDDSIKQKLNTTKDKADIVIEVGENEIIIVECKSIKEKGYNKYSMVSRQVNSYKVMAEKANYAVKKIFIIAPEFTDDFVNECGLDYELNLSLIHAETLLSIYEAFVETKMKTLPLSLLMRDVLLNKERVLKAMGR